MWKEICQKQFELSQIELVMRIDRLDVRLEGCFFDTNHVAKGKRERKCACKK